MMGSETGSGEIPWHLGVFDAHCHPTDTVASLQAIPNMRAKALTIMATRAQDQALVAQVADDYGLTESEMASVETDWCAEHKIVPAFGWHPWFSHQIYDESEYEGATFLSLEQKVTHYQTVLSPEPQDRAFLQALPDPKPIGEFLALTKANLERYPMGLVGEVGLDRSFRIPEAWLPEQADRRDDALTPGGREGRRLSPYRVSMEHQKRVLLAQLSLAGEMQRAVSVHGVQAHGAVYETVAKTWKGHERRILSKKERRKVEAAARANMELKGADDETEQATPKPFPPRICLHSFSGPADTVKQYTATTVPCEIFFSFSTSINGWSEDGTGKVETAVRAVPDDRLLIESDLHTAGEQMDLFLEDAVRKICAAKRWTYEIGVRQLGRNWKRFAFGEIQ